METHSGSCLCGQVSYVLRGEPENQGHCHCMACKKATSASFATLVYYDASFVEPKWNVYISRQLPFISIDKNLDNFEEGFKK